MRIGVRDGRRRRERITLGMSSLIDVVFLLLAYFLLTTVVTQREDRLSPNLQIDRETSGSEYQDFVPQVLEVMVENNVVVYRLGARDFTSRGELVKALDELPKEPGLFVRVHSGPTVAAAAAAIQSGRDVGFTEVTYVPVKD